MEQFTAFSDMEKRRLDDLVPRNQIDHAPKEDIIGDGEHSANCHVVLSGLACRYKTLPDGRRQIMAFLIPGDLCDAEIFVLKVMDHGVSAIVPTRTALVSGADMKSLLRETSSLGEALWWGTMTDLGVLRERIIDHGRRTAYVRTAHLLYELLVRYRMVELAKDNRFGFPITQTDLADATGLTPVHANRTLKKVEGGRPGRFFRRRRRRPRRARTEESGAVQWGISASGSRARPADGGSASRRSGLAAMPACGCSRR